MTNCCFDINFRHGFDVLEITAGSNQIRGEEWWSRWGLFCNDVLIAETSRVYPRLSNLSVPFKLFVGSQPCVVVSVCCFVAMLESTGAAILILVGIVGVFG